MKKEKIEMPKTKYKELCDAYDKGVKDCEEYRQECYDFVQELRSYIIGTLKCAESKIFMFSPSQGFVHKSQIIQGDALDTEFEDNGTALIGFAINVNDQDLKDKFFTFIISFKKVADMIVFGIPFEDKEFNNTSKGMESFCKYFFSMAKENLSKRLEIFLQSPEEQSAPIGFKVSKG